MPFVGGPKDKKIIALLTDFGLKDPYVGVIRAIMLDINPNLLLIDFTHEVESQNVKEAAFLLNCYYRDFPKGSIFLAVVDPGVGSKRRAILVKTRDYFFVGPDNGIFSYIFLDEPQHICYELKEKGFFRSQVSSTFHARDIFAPVCAHISCGVKPEEFGPKVNDPIILESLFPKIEQNFIEGELLHIDKFGNLITNIHPKFLDISSNSKLKVFIKGKEIPFVTTYSDVNIGSLLSLWGSSGFLEISVNQGSAIDRLNVRLGERVRVIF